MMPCQTQLRLRIVFCLLPLLWACGGEKKTVSAADEKLTPGELCLSRAEAVRTPPEDAPGSIGVAHILVQHKDLHRPAGATRTRAEACLRALEARSALEEGEDWDAVVKNFSDSGESTNGDLGMVTRQEVTKPFGDAAFSLDVDELSYVVESDRGFHIIVRTR